MKTLRAKLWLGLIAISLMGCVTNGENFSSRVDWIKQGTTDKGSVRKLLGSPYSVGRSAGRETWTYGYYRYKMLGKSYQKELKLYWDDTGKVHTYSFNSSFPEDTAHAGRR